MPGRNGDDKETEKRADRDSRKLILRASRVKGNAKGGDDPKSTKGGKGEKK